MKRIFAGLLILAVCLSAFNTSVFAERTVTVELVDFVNYINTEDTNSVIVKTTNNTDKAINIRLILEIKNQDGQNVFSKEIPVSLNKKSVIHTATEIGYSEEGEYNLCLSAYNGNTFMTSYTEYLFIKNKAALYENIGVCTHFDFNTFYELSDIKFLKDSGFSIIRDECRWQNVEKSKGKYKIPQHVTKYIDEAKNNGVEVLLMLAFNNTFYTENECDIPKTEDNIKAWLEYVRFVVKELKGKVKYFEVWNEPNHENFNKNNATAAEFTYFLSRTYEVIKEEYPEAYVVSGGIAGSSYASDYIKEMVESGALDYLDAFGIHPYCRDKTIVDERTQTTFSSDIDYLINDCGVTKPIWIPEVGYSTHEEEYTDVEKGAYNVRTMLEFIADGRVEKLLMYQLKHTERGEGYGMIHSDGTAYDSFKIVHNLGERIGNADFVKKWSGDYYSVYQFKDRETEDDIFVLWTKKSSSLELNLLSAANEPKAEYQRKYISNSLIKLDTGAANSESDIYKYDAYGNKTEITAGSVGSIDFKPTYIVCEKPEPEAVCDITYGDGKVNVQGRVDDCEYVTVRAVGKNSGKEVYLNQIKTQSGMFDISFDAQNKDVYEIYVYNGKTNYQKYNIGSIDARISITADDKEITGIKEIGNSEKREAVIQIDNQTENGEELLFIAAVYADGERLEFVDVRGIAPDMKEKVIVELPEGDTSGWEKIKLFLWEANTKSSVTQSTEIR